MTRVSRYQEIFFFCLNNLLAFKSASMAFFESRLPNRDSPSPTYPSPSSDRSAVVFSKAVIASGNFLSAFKELAK